MAERVAREAHPRSRGENIGVRRPCGGRGGSSPLTRGKPVHGLPGAGPQGLIPAHAGKTGFKHVFQDVGRAHPRSRGENPEYTSVLSRIGGSSPLTRGKQTGEANALKLGGLIPAHAGKTGLAAVTSAEFWAHPRSRGENIGLSAPPCWVTGSSPLTRGKPGRRARVEDLRGLIPAHAGKTTWALLGRARRRAHPRSRGENDRPSIQRALREGSSPLTRGKHGSRVPHRGPAGLIPAHAGKTRAGRLDEFHAGAHPRSRGENGWRQDEGGEQAGSSPLTRGKPELCKWKRDRLRLIPAHAGKTATAQSRACLSGAHPRSRGENAEGRRG